MAEDAGAKGAGEVILNLSHQEWQKRTDDDFQIYSGGHWKPVLARLKELGFKVEYETGGGIAVVTLRWLDEAEDPPTGGTPAS